MFKRLWLIVQVQTMCREYRATFNLKQQKYNNREIYYLVIQDEDGLQMPVKEEMHIDISISFDDFDFFS